MNHFKLVSLAAAIALASGMNLANATVSASGTAYAVASTNVTNLAIASTGVTFGTTPALTSSVSASGSTTSSGTVGGLPYMAADFPAFPALPLRPSTSLANFYLPLGPAANAGATYANAGALHDAGVQVAAVGTAFDIAEIHQVGPGTANASAGNKYVNTFTAAATGGVLDFRFFADPYLAINTAGTATSSASMIFSIVITSGSTVVFSWFPDGVLTGLLGGVEFSDSENLNLTISAAGAAGAQFSSASIFNPFAAQSNLLIPGNYTLTINMPETVSASVSASVVPEPGSIALLGIGLLGLVGAASARRRKP